jgi:hypothetical protein
MEGTPYTSHLTRLFIQKDTGFVGIGNADPKQNLSVAGTGYFSGNVGIGDSNPQSKLVVAGDARIGGALNLDDSAMYFTNKTHKHSALGNEPGHAAIENAQDYDALMILGRSTGGTRIVQMYDDVTVGGKLFVNGILAYKWGNQWKQLYQEREGWAGSRDTSEKPSDTRLKTDLQPITSPLKKVSQLRGVTFRWNEQGLLYLTKDIEVDLSAGPGASDEENRKVWQEEREKRYKELSKSNVGVVAQDVEAVLPQAVTTDASGYKFVNYTELIPLVIEALKEEYKNSQEQAQTIASQQGEIQRLTVANQTAQEQLSELQELKQKLAYLEASVSRLVAEPSGDRKETTNTGQSGAMQRLPSSSK